MNNNQKLLKMMSVVEYDISQKALAKLMKVDASRFNKIINKRNLTDDELKNIKHILETNEYVKVFDFSKKCKLCDKTFEPLNNIQKFCCTECCRKFYDKKRESNYKETIPSTKIHIHLPFGKSQEILDKATQELTKKGMTYGEMSKQREIERIWGKI